MRVLVFGAAGFVGRNLVSSLAKSKHETKACDAVENPFSPQTKYLRVDVLDRAHVFDTVKGCDSVVHLAASPLVASIQDPAENMRVNIEGTLNILDAARKHDVKKLIYSSASSVIGMPKYNPVDEEHPCIPKTPYAVAKKACEDYLRVYRELYSLHYVIFRFFNLYGPWQFVGSGALIPNVYRTLSENKDFQIFGDGSSTRDFIYIDDVVNYCVSALTQPIEDVVVNLGTGQGTSILELVRLSAKLLGVEPRLAYKPSRPGEIGNFVADTTRLTKLFGTKPSTSLEDGLRKTFEWLHNPHRFEHSEIGVTKVRGF